MPCRKPPFVPRPLRALLLASLLLMPAFTLPGGPLTFRSMDLHPDVRLQPYLSGPILDAAGTPRGSLQAFRDLLALYAQRQRDDDNFTIRVTDSRTDRLVELYVLEAERARFEREGTADWEAVDRKRREATRRVLDRHEQQGYPRSHLRAKWGRANQVLEARRREEPVLMYEVRLARALGLSLLATEIGTVETFNNDRMVSSAGARGRYQMMPFLLRAHGLRHYNLETAAGTRLTVADEWHPLLTMEPAFLTLRGYVNAVGHEIPGLSAYHAGPGNIFRIYRLFMEHAGTFSPQTHVADAYVWGLTDGFDRVSQGSSFGSYSRGYVPSAYGSLRAAEELPIDTTKTMLAERVQLKPGHQIYLSHLLRTLAGLHAPFLAEPEAAGERDDLYARFRQLNPHIPLPPATDGVPVRGDVLLTATAAGGPVRFFLPLGATEHLAAEGIDLLDAEATFRFDHTTYAEPAARTTWDDQYDALVEEVARFGFTMQNRTRLSQLRARFEQLAEAHPTPYRQRQLHIIRTHERLWLSAPWETLADATRQATRTFPKR